MAPCHTARCPHGTQRGCGGYFFPAKRLKNRFGSCTLWSNASVPTPLSHLLLTKGLWGYHLIPHAGSQTKGCPLFWGQTTLCWGTEQGHEFSSAITSQLGLHSAAPGRLNVAVTVAFLEDSGDVFLLLSEKHLVAHRHVVLGDETRQLETSRHIRYVLNTLLQH